MVSSPAGEAGRGRFDPAAAAGVPGSDAARAGDHRAERRSALIDLGHEFLYVFGLTILAIEAILMIGTIVLVMLYLLAWGLNWLMDGVRIRKR
jgi:hypothetical protein